MPDGVVPATEEPGHIVRYRSPRFVLYTNNFLPGHVTLYHSHRNDLLAVIAGDSIAVNQKPGGEPTEQKVPAGTVVLFPYADLPSPYVHRISVAGELPFINIGVEFLDAIPSAEMRAQLMPLKLDSVTMISDNRRGRGYSVALAAGQTLAIPSQGSAVLVVAVDEGQLQLDDAAWTVTKGDFRFFESTRPKRVSNSSTHGIVLILFHAF